MKITRMNKGDWGKTKAFFDLEVEGFTLKGFTLVDGIHGLFAGFPSQKGHDDEYRETVWADKKLKGKVNELAIAAYGQESPEITETQPVAATETTEAAISDEDIPF